MDHRSRMHVCQCLLKYLAVRTHCENGRLPKPVTACPDPDSDMSCEMCLCACLWDIESYVVCGCVRGVLGLLANFLQLHKYVSDCMYIRLKAVYFESKLQHLASCCVNGACFIMLPKSAYDKVCWACYCSLSLCTDHKSHLKVPIIAYWFKCVDTVLAEARKAVWFHIIGCIYGLEFIF